MSEDYYKTTKYTRNDMDAALCMWEYSLARQMDGDNSVFDWLRAGEGSAAARDMCIDLASDLDTSYQVAVELGYDTCFDWEFVPRWLRLAMELTVTHDLMEPWVDYMGRAIYREYEDGMQHIRRTRYT